MNRKLVVLSLCVFAGFFSLYAFNLWTSAKQAQKYGVITEYGSRREAEQALKKNPRDLLAMRTMITEHSLNRDHKEAMVWVRRAFEVSPGDRPTQLKHARLLYQLNRTDEAFVILDQLSRGSDEIAEVAKITRKQLSAKKHSSSRVR
jgi:hypothetical protein